MSSGPPPTRMAVPVGDDHPLAAGASVMPPPPSQQQQQSVSPSRPPPQSISPARPMGGFASPPPPNNSSENTVSPSSKSLEALADDFLSSKPPPISLKPNPLPKGEAGIARLRTLVERRAWADVLKLAATLLGNEDGSGKPKSSSSSKSEEYSRVYKSLRLDHDNNDVDEVPSTTRQETIEIMTLQCHAWLKMRRYGDLTKEVKQWKFLKQNDVNAKPIEWLPWGIHILGGQSLEYSDEKNQATDILCHLREDIPTTEYGWLVTLDNALANTYIRRGEWRLALGSLDRIIDLIPEATKLEVQSLLATGLGAESDETITAFLTNAYTCEILSRQGRIFLQAGGLSEASELFEDAKSLWKESESSSSTLGTIALGEELSRETKTVGVAIPAMMQINDGLIHFSESSYETATQCFSEAINRLRNTDTWSHPSNYRAQEWMGPAVAGHQPLSLLYNEAVNNTTLCHLYTCNMRDAVVALEGLVREDPTAFLTERVAFNLCTLYELGSDSAVATRQKKVLQLIAKRYFLHDVGPESFRVT